jgi:hypothetical protein
MFNDVSNRLTSEASSKLNRRWNVRDDEAAARSIIFVFVHFHLKTDTDKRTKLNGIKIANLKDGRYST